MGKDFEITPLLHKIKSKKQGNFFPRVCLHRHDLAYQGKQLPCLEIIKEDQINYCCRYHVFKVFVQSLQKVAQKKAIAKLQFKKLALDCDSLFLYLFSLDQYFAYFHPFTQSGETAPKVNYFDYGGEVGRSRHLGGKRSVKKFGLDVFSKNKYYSLAVGDYREPLGAFRNSQFRLEKVILALSVVSLFAGLALRLKELFLFELHVNEVPEVLVVRRVRDDEVIDFVVEPEVAELGDEAENGLAVPYQSGAESFALEQELVLEVQMVLDSENELSICELLGVHDQQAVEFSQFELRFLLSIFIVSFNLKVIELFDLA
jgi:hypothetical protein